MKYFEIREESYIECVNHGRIRVINKNYIHWKRQHGTMTIEQFKQHITKLEDCHTRLEDE